MSGPPTDDKGWFELVLSNQPPLWKLMAERAGAGLGGRRLHAAIVPAPPNRLFNSVFYGDTERLLYSRLVSLRPTSARRQRLDRLGAGDG